jgi:hypothetical protein
MAAVWPGATAHHRSPHYATLAPHPYPAGPRGLQLRGRARLGVRRPAPIRARGRAAAPARRRRAARLELANGGVPAHAATFATAHPIDDKDAQLALTRAAIDTQMITYPPHAGSGAREPGWRTIRDALLGVCTSAVAVRRIQAVAEEVLAA